MEQIIISKVADHCRVSFADMRSPSRFNKIVKARHIAFYLMRKHTNLSSSQIGSLLFRDHTTTLHACKSVENQMKLYSTYRNEIEDLSREIQNALPVLIEGEEVFMEPDFFTN